MSGTSIELDKKLCLSIRECSGNDLPLRIADARPKLNANANAAMGKGFENVSFLGGPSMAQLQFLDIENIHVMRSSITKLRESSGFSPLTSPANASGSGIDAAHDDSAGVEKSKWLTHISLVLRGAVGVADSLSLGHAVLVHCSDGWDRTAQLSALSQVLLDPYYRTIEGFLCIVQKGMCKLALFP